MPNWNQWCSETTHPPVDLPNTSGPNALKFSPPPIDCELENSRKTSELKEINIQSIFIKSYVMI